MPSSMDSPGDVIVLAGKGHEALSGNQRREI